MTIDPEMPSKSKPDIGMVKSSQSKDQLQPQKRIHNSSVFNRKRLPAKKIFRENKGQYGIGVRFDASSSKRLSPDFSEQQLDKFSGRICRDLVEFIAFLESQNPFQNGSTALAQYSMQFCASLA